MVPVNDYSIPGSSYDKGTWLGSRRVKNTTSDIRKGIHQGVSHKGETPYLTRPTGRRGPPFSTSTTPLSMDEDLVETVEQQVYSSCRITGSQNNFGVWRVHQWKTPISSLIEERTGLTVTVSQPPLLWVTYRNSLLPRCLITTTTQENRETWTKEISHTS